MPKIILALITVLFFCHSYANETPTCEKNFQTETINEETSFFPQTIDNSTGRPIPVYVVPFDKMRSSTQVTLALGKTPLLRAQKQYIFVQRVSPRPSVYIGLFAEGHTYITVFDGNKSISFHSAVFQMSRVLRLPALRKGIVFRIDDPNLELGKQILSDFEANPTFRTTTCAEGVCRVLARSVDIKIDGKPLNTILPSDIVKKLVSGTQVTCHGQPIKMETYLLGVKTIADLNKTRIKTEAIYVAGAAAGLGLAVETLSLLSRICPLF